MLSLPKSVRVVWSNWNFVLRLNVRFLSTLCVWGLMFRGWILPLLRFIYTVCMGPYVSRQNVPSVTLLPWKSLEVVKTWTHWTLSSVVMWGGCTRCQTHLPVRPEAWRTTSFHSYSKQPKIPRSDDLDILGCIDDTSIKFMQAQRNFQIWNQENPKKIRKMIT